jgi:hypothetical protein
MLKDKNGVEIRLSDWIRHEDGAYESRFNGPCVGFEPSKWIVCRRADGSTPENARPRYSTGEHPQPGDMAQHNRSGGATRIRRLTDDGRLHIGFVAMDPKEYSLLERGTVPEEKPKPALFGSVTYGARTYSTREELERDHGVGCPGAGMLPSERPVLGKDRHGKDVRRLLFDNAILGKSRRPGFVAHMSAERARDTIEWFEMDHHEADLEQLDERVERKVSEMLQELGARVMGKRP